MAKRTSRVAWGLAVVLSGIVFGSGGVLFGFYQRSRDIAVGPVHMLPVGQWRVGRQLVIRPLCRAVAFEPRLNLGFCYIIWR